MKLKITYPHVERKKVQRHHLIRWARWPVGFGAFICVVLNLVIGGPGWSLIVLWALWMLWSFVISPDLVEYNRISFFIRVIATSSVMLIIIDALFPSGWSIEVVPIVCFTGLMIAALLFFTDLERQKQNMLPLIILIAISLISSVVGLFLWHEESRWALAVLGVIALSLLTAFFVILGGDFVREIKKRFHVR